jgi:hypothetical protein
MDQFLCDKFRFCVTFILHTFETNIHDGKKCFDTKKTESENDYKKHKRANN